MQMCWCSAAVILILNMNAKTFALCNDKEMDKVREERSYVFEGFCKIPIAHCNR